MEENKIRVRFAPSPTGFLHIGGARTALFNWLFARHGQGTFVLRIEDTDRARSELRFRDEILESLKWLGMDWDEGPYYQSDRFEIYQDYAQKLIQKGCAYKSEGAIVFKIPSENVQIDDLVYGRLEFDNSLLNELVIIKSDGTPTYNFSCVIDDATMQMSHIIRGDDHISNTPKQVALYKALELSMPKFAHVPMILGSDGQRLSKRHGATAVTQYRETGFLPESIINFLALLGWSPGGDKELMEKNEMIELFTLERVNRKSAIFNLEKLEWMNSQYIRKVDQERLIKDILPLLKEKWGKEPEKVYLENVIGLFRERFKTYQDFVEQTAYFFNDTLVRDAEAVSKYLSNPQAREYLKSLKEKIQPMDCFDSAVLETMIRDMAKSIGVKAGDIIHPLRVALTGKAVSPGIFDVLRLMGKNMVLKRIEEVISGSFI